VTPDNVFKIAVEVPEKEDDSEPAE